MATHATIGESYAKRETWKLYTEYLVWYFATNSMESADKLKSMLYIFEVCVTLQLIKNS